MSIHTASATIFNELEIELQFSICGSDRSVGIMEDYIEEWWVTHINGVRITNLKSRDKFCERVEADAIAMRAVDDAMRAVWQSTCEA